MKVMLDIATGTVFIECKPRHRRQEFLAFLKRINSAVPAHPDVHLTLRLRQYDRVVGGRWTSRWNRYHSAGLMP
jgi:putative transposase